MKNIVITGASSGMGEALARIYAAPGVALGLVGRNAARLAKVAEAGTASGAACTQGALDVTDGDEVRRFVEDFDRRNPIDLLVVNAGIFDGRRPGQEIEDLETSLRVIETNLHGALATVHAALPGMRRRGRGHIVIMSSLAGFTPIGGGLGYSASKAAVLSYGLGLKQLLHPMGIKVSVVCPGFVETPITQRHLGWQPFRITAAQAARKIRRGIERENAIIAFPLPLHLMTRMAILMPDFVRRVVGRVFACHAGAEAAPDSRPLAPAGAVRAPEA